MRSWYIWLIKRLHCSLKICPQYLLLSVLPVGVGILLPLTTSVLVGFVVVVAGIPLCTVVVREESVYLLFTMVAVVTAM